MYNGSRGRDDGSAGDMYSLKVPASRGSDSRKTSQDSMREAKTFFDRRSEQWKFFEGGERSILGGINFLLKSLDKSRRLG